ncbi:Uncharacterized protein PCOAH_00025230 [Plasmodium coatneyi]|uniref:Uncharacterized protein n=1 Tax=Plasmodium coatneyi TaxID=208452 RepID=A0A1B1DZJ9_9APIC|nr:Uncharacterized protein PCOAH_00025230 [Plasmodium coatneyi]ANQ08160.1 Uncharacterized protein PCOAH_00025230 [Plasmodium coatneyi]
MHVCMQLESLSQVISPLKFFYCRKVRQRSKGVRSRGSRSEREVASCRGGEEDAKLGEDKDDEDSSHGSSVGSGDDDDDETAAQGDHSDGDSHQMSNGERMSKAERKKIKIYLKLNEGLDSIKDELRQIDRELKKILHKESLHLDAFYKFIQADNPASGKTHSVNNLQKNRSTESVVEKEPQEICLTKEGRGLDKEEQLGTSRGYSPDSTDSPDYAGSPNSSDYLTSPNSPGSSCSPDLPNEASPTNLNDESHLNGEKKDPLDGDKLAIGTKGKRDSLLRRDQEETRNVIDKKSPSVESDPQNGQVVSADSAAADEAISDGGADAIGPDGETTELGEASPKSEVKELEASSSKVKEMSASATVGKGGSVNEVKEMGSSATVGKASPKNEVKEMGSSATVGEAGSVNEVKEMGSYVKVGKASPKNEVKEMGSSVTVGKASPKNEVKEMGSSVKVGEASPKSGVRDTEAPNRSNESDASNRAKKSDASNRAKESDVPNRAEESDAPNRTKESDASKKLEETEESNLVKEISEAIQVKGEEAPNEDKEVGSLNQAKEMSSSDQLKEVDSPGQLKVDLPSKNANDAAEGQKGLVKDAVERKRSNQQEVQKVDGSSAGSDAKGQGKEGEMAEAGGKVKDDEGENAHHDGEEGSNSRGRESSFFNAIQNLFLRRDRKKVQKEPPKEKVEEEQVEVHKMNESEKSEKDETGEKMPTAESKKMEDDAERGDDELAKFKSSNGNDADVGVCANNADHSIDSINSDTEVRSDVSVYTNAKSEGEAIHVDKPEESCSGASMSQDGRGPTVSRGENDLKEDEHGEAIHMKGSKGDEKGEEKYAHERRPPNVDPTVVRCKDKSGSLDSGDTHQSEGGEKVVIEEDTKEDVMDDVTNEWRSSLDGTDEIHNQNGDKPVTDSNDCIKKVEKKMSHRNGQDQVNQSRSENEDTSTGQSGVTKSDPTGHASEAGNLKTDTGENSCREGEKSVTGEQNEQSKQGEGTPNGDKDGYLHEITKEGTIVEVKGDENKLEDGKMEMIEEVSSVIASEAGGDVTDERNLKSLCVSESADREENDGHDSLVGGSKEFTNAGSVQLSDEGSERRGSFVIGTDYLKENDMKETPSIIEAADSGGTASRKKSYVIGESQFNQDTVKKNSHDSSLGRLTENAPEKNSFVRRAADSNEDSRREASPMNGPDDSNENESKRGSYNGRKGHSGGNISTGDSPPERAIDSKEKEPKTGSYMSGSGDWIDKDTKNMEGTKYTSHMNRPDDVSESISEKLHVDFATNLSVNQACDSNENKSEASFTNSKVISNASGAEESRDHSPYRASENVENDLCAGRSGNADRSEERRGSYIIDPDYSYGRSAKKTSLMNRPSYSDGRSAKETPPINRTVYSHENGSYELRINNATEVFADRSGDLIQNDTSKTTGSYTDPSGDASEKTPTDGSYVRKTDDFSENNSKRDSCVERTSATNKRNERNELHFFINRSRNSSMKKIKKGSHVDSSSDSKENDAAELGETNTAELGENNTAELGVNNTDELGVGSVSEICAEGVSYVDSSVGFEGRSGSYMKRSRKGSHVDGSRKDSYVDESRKDSYVDESRRGSYVDESRRGSYVDESRRGSYVDESRRGSYVDGSRRGSYVDGSRRRSYVDGSRRGSYVDGSRRGSYVNGSRKDSYVDESRKGSHVDESRKSSYVDGSRKDSYVEGFRKDSYVDGSRKGSHVDGFRKDSHVDGSRKGSHVDGFRKDSYVDGFRKDSYVDGSRKDSYVDGSRKGSYVDGSRKGSYVDGSRKDSYAAGSRKGSYMSKETHLNEDTKKKESYVITAGDSNETSKRKTSPISSSDNFSDSNRKKSSHIDRSDNLSETSSKTGSYMDTWGETRTKDKSVFYINRSGDMRGSRSRKASHISRKSDVGQREESASCISRAGGLKENDTGKTSYMNRTEYSNENEGSVSLVGESSDLGEVNAKKTSFVEEESDSHLNRSGDLMGNGSGKLKVGASNKLNVSPSGDLPRNDEEENACINRPGYPCESSLMEEHTEEATMLSVNRSENATEKRAVRMSINGGSVSSRRNETGNPLYLTSGDNFIENDLKEWSLSTSKGSSSVKKFGDSNGRDSKELAGDGVNKIRENSSGQSDEDNRRKSYFSVTDNSKGETARRRSYVKGTDNSNEDILNEACTEGETSFSITKLSGMSGGKSNRGAFTDMTMPSSDRGGRKTSHIVNRTGGSNESTARDTSDMNYVDNTEKDNTNESIGSISVGSNRSNTKKGLRMSRSNRLNEDPSKSQPIVGVGHSNEGSRRKESFMERSREGSNIDKEDHSNKTSERKVSQIISPDNWSESNRKNPSHIHRVYNSNENELKEETSINNSGDLLKNGNRKVSYTDRSSHYNENNKEESTDVNGSDDSKEESTNELDIDGATKFTVNTSDHLVKKNGRNTSHMNKPNDSNEVNTRKDSSFEKTIHVSENGSRKTLHVLKAGTDEMANKTADTNESDSTKACINSAAYISGSSSEGVSHVSGLAYVSEGNKKEGSFINRLDSLSEDHKKIFPIGKAADFNDKREGGSHMSRVGYSNEINNNSSLMNRSGELDEQREQDFSTTRLGSAYQTNDTASHSNGVDELAEKSDYDPCMNKSGDIDKRKDPTWKESRVVTSGETKRTDASRASSAVSESQKPIKKLREYFVSGKNDSGVLKDNTRDVTGGLRSRGTNEKGTNEKGTDEKNNPHRFKNFQGKYKFQMNMKEEEIDELQKKLKDEFQMLHEMSKKKNSLKNILENCVHVKCVDNSKEVTDEEQYDRVDLKHTLSGNEKEHTGGDETGKVHTTGPLPDVQDESAFEDTRPEEAFDMSNFSTEMSNREMKKLRKWKSLMISKEHKDDWLSSDVLLWCFLNFIKLKKIVSITELSVKFQTKRENIRRKLKELEEHDMIQGVMDMEENYIYLSQEEVTKLCVEILSIEKIKTHEDFVEICNKVISLSINDQDVQKLKEVEEKIVEANKKRYSDFACTT